jgi:hypothetical protein
VCERERERERVDRALDKENEEGRKEGRKEGRPAEGCKRVTRPGSGGRPWQECDTSAPDSPPSETPQTHLSLSLSLSLRSTLLFSYHRPVSLLA